MAVTVTDSELNKYWSLLTQVQKDSILSVIKSFIGSAESGVIDQYNKEIDEAVARVGAGEFYTHEEVDNHISSPNDPSASHMAQS